MLHRKIRAAVDPLTADIALAVYDLDEIADRLADRADYDTLTALISADLAPARLALPAPAPPELRCPSLHCPSSPTGSCLTQAPPTTISAGPVRVPGEVEVVAESELVAAQPVDVPAGLPPVRPAGASRGPGSRTLPAYEPVSDEDAAMYELWRRGVAAGQEPSGADLARAAGRANDASGIGRKAARRYREAHAEARDTSAAALFTDAHSTAAQSTHPQPTAAPHNGAPAPWPHNGHRPHGDTA